MEKIETGGRAFPGKEQLPVKDMNGGPGILLEQFHQGMTLRDFFAAAALPALISRCMGNLDKIEYTAEMMAKSAYEHADAMLKQSAQTEKGESK